MKEGDEVICISEYFPVWKTTEEDKSIIGTHPHSHPKKGEILTIDETLGEFLRFEKYDTHTFNWWHHSRFKKCELDVIEKNVELFHELKYAH